LEEKVMGDFEGREKQTEREIATKKRISTWKQIFQPHCSFAKAANRRLRWHSCAEGEEKEKKSQM